MTDTLSQAFNATELDWTHINETILMIGLAVAQIEKTLNDGDESIGVLTGSFIRMMASINSITKELHELPDTTELKTKSARALVLVAEMESDESNSKAKTDELKEIITILAAMGESSAKETISASAQEAGELIQETIIAFQFYDRLSQRLHQIVSSLGMMSQLFADKQRLHNPYEWAELQDSIKSRYTIDADRIMFDALLAGASIEEAVEIATDYEGETETEETEVELF